ncbi:hypothetical protein D6D00_09078 [Aureobasidium pullulans]|nr:hypothetical protein D6D00_09078 [Aureobasidium pullulans]
MSQLPYIKVSYRERLTKAINENIHPRDPSVLRDGPKSHGPPVSDSSFLPDQSISATTLLDPTQAVSHKPRKLICAIDDTSMDHYAESSSRRHGSHSPTQSNISRISRAVKPEDSSKAPQIVYYQAGLVGQFGLLNKRGLPYLPDILSDWETAGDPKSPGSIFWEHFRDSADPEKQHSPRTPSNDPSQVASYLEEYKLMLRNWGLTHMIPKHEPGYSDVTVRTVAVFDSLGGLDMSVLPWLQRLFGLQLSIQGTRWFDTLLEESTANAFQALALDEHRPFSPPAVWRKVLGSKTNLKQVWFPATHDDCGGMGSDTVAADVSLAWMMDQLSGSRLQSRHLDHFDPSDWIEFDNSYLNLQQRTRIIPSQDNFTVEGFLWGAVYAILKLLHGLLGRTVRTPGQYTFKDPDSHSEPASSPRLETKEFIHSSVRARVSEGWNRQGTIRYRPEALRRWRLIGKDEEDASSVTRARWEWRGSKLRMPQESVLDEDIPETLEMQLLERLEPVLAGSVQKRTGKETKKEV